MAEKVTIMVLKVDLECTKCYKKVKKLLCKYPQIRDQLYDDKANTVTIMVVCCSPEKIRDKLCYKGRGTIISIDIKEPPEKKKSPEPDTKKAPEPDTKKEPEKPNPEQEKPKPVEKPPAEKPKDTPKNVIFVAPPIVDTPKPPPKAPEPGPKGPEPGPKASEPAPKPPPEPVPIIAYPPPYYMPTPACCGTCYDGQPGGPCYGGHGMPMSMGPPPCNCGCGGWSNCYNGYGGGGYTINRCNYFSEENPSACTIM